MLRWRLVKALIYFCFDDRSLALIFFSFDNRALAMVFRTVRCLLEAVVQTGGGAVVSLWT